MIYNVSISCNWPRTFENVPKTDSRGSGLQEEIVKINRGEYLEVRMVKGATLHQLANLARKHLVRYPFDVIYLAGGACDIINW